MPSLPTVQYHEATEPFTERPMRRLRRIPLWLYVPPMPDRSPAFHSVPDTAVSTSASPSPNPDIGLYVSSSGKPMLRPLSWQGWQTRPWIRLLCGTISSPLTAAHGVTAFISSLPAIRASRSASQASVVRSAIRATSGLMSPALSTKSAQRPSSPKTSKGTSIWDFPRSRAALKSWAIGQKRACSRREKLALATAGDGSSSWPTPTATNAGYYPDLVIEMGRVQPKAPWDIVASSSGQFALDTAARVWTYLWLIIAALGLDWSKRTSRSSPPVRVSFKHGKGSFFDGLISNPRFYELMFGWPVDWTAPEASVTEFPAWLQRMRTALFALPSLGNGEGPQDDA